MQCRIDVLCGVVLPEAQNGSGMETAVSGVLALESGKESLCCFPKGKKRIFDRLQSVTHLGVRAMLRVFHCFDVPAARRS